MRTLVFIVFSVWSYGGLFEAQGQVSPHPSGVHYDASNGLPGSVVYRAVQDLSGFIWIATDAGLARFDGHRFDVFTRLNGLPDNEVLNIFVDRRNCLWIQTFDGIAYMPQARDTIYLLPLPGGEELVSSFEGKDGRVWITTRRQIIKLEDGAPDSMTVYKDDANISRPCPIGQYPDQTLLFLSWGGRFTRLNPDDFSLQTTQKNPNSPFLLPPNAIYIDGKGFLIGSFDGLRFLDNSEKPFVEGLDGIPVSVVERDRSGIYWFGGGTKGISSYRLEEGGFVLEDNMLPGERVSDLMEDRDGNLWVSTMGKGLFFFPKSYRQMTYHLPINLGLDPSVFSMHIASDSSIWLGCTNYVIRIDPQGRMKKYEPFPNPRSYNRVLKILEPKPGELLFVTDLGIGAYQGGKISIYSNIQASKCAIEAREGGIWLGTGQGLTFFSKDYIPANDNLRPLGNRIQYPGRVYSILEGDSCLWLGGVDGLFRYENETLIGYGEKDKYLSYFVADLAQGPFGELWVASKGGGVTCVTDKGVVHIETKDGLASMNCHCLYIKGNILIAGTNQGASFFELGVPGTVPTHLHTLSNQDGLVGNEIWDIELDHDIVHLATSGGLASFPLQLIYESGTNSQVFFQEMLAGNQVINLSNYKESIHLDRGVNDVTIKFTALDFLGGKDLQYRYQLDGLDKDWVTGRSEVVRYSHLPAGSYTFRVQVRRSNAAWPQMVQSLSFVITPPFWASWWFIVLMLILGILAIMAIQSFFMRRKERTRLRITLDRQTRELRNTNKELQRSNEELRKFAYVVSHDLKSPLRTISSFTQLIKRKTDGKLEENIQEYLDLVEAGAKQMNSLVVDLLSYAQIGGGDGHFQELSLSDLVMEVQRKLAHSIKESHCQIEKGVLPHVIGIRYQLSLVIQNLIENAIKFQGASAPFIVIRADEDDRFWYISVEDNGIGIEAEYQIEVFNIFKRLHAGNYEGTGIGLSICKKIIDLHGGTLALTSTLGQGSCFTFSLPKVR